MGKLNITGVRGVLIGAFRQIDECIRCDSRLTAIGLKVQSWRGEPQDVSTLGPESMPSLRLTPGSGPGGWITEGQHQFTIPILCEMRVKGTDVADLYELWEGVINALLAEPGADRDRIEAIKTRVDPDVEIMQLRVSGLPGVDLGLSNEQSIAGSSQIEIDVWVPTQE